MIMMYIWPFNTQNSNPSNSKLPKIRKKKINIKIAEEQEF